MSPIVYKVKISRRYRNYTHNFNLILENPVPIASSVQGGSSRQVIFVNNRTLGKLHTRFI